MRNEWFSASALLQWASRQVRIRAAVCITGLLVFASPVQAQSGGYAFDDMVEDVVLSASADRAAIIDSFLATVASFPIIEGDSAIFVYRGGASSASVAGDMNGWNPDITLNRLVDTDLFYGVREYEDTARLDYKIVLNGSNWILDPRNPNQVSGGFGPNSELAMPGYVQPEEIHYRPDLPHGTNTRSDFASTILGNSRSVTVYTPADFDSTAEYGVVVFKDGGDYLNLASAKNVIDNLIGDGMIQPVVAAFVPPVDRNNEYAFDRTDDYEQFVITELMPWLRTEYSVTSDPSRTAITGPSFGGLISTQICYRNPDVFGLCGPVSPAYWAKDKEVLNEVINGEKKDIRFYVDWGSYEPTIAATGHEFVNGLEAKGYELEWNEWYEGHSWGSWRAHLDNMLVMFFGNTPTGVVDDDLPGPSTNLTSYPNPFTDDTTLVFRVDRPTTAAIEIFDLIGRRVSAAKRDVAGPGEHRERLRMDSVAPGTYFARVVVGEEVYTTSLFKVR